MVENNAEDTLETIRKVLKHYQMQSVNAYSAQNFFWTLDRLVNGRDDDNGFLFGQFVEDISG